MRLLLFLARARMQRETGWRIPKRLAKKRGTGTMEMPRLPMDMAELDFFGGRGSGMEIDDSNALAEARAAYLPCPMRFQPGNKKKSTWMIPTARGDPRSRVGWMG